jgi:hypothetical protein
MEEVLKERVRVPSRSCGQMVIEVSSTDEVRRYAYKDYRVETSFGPIRLDWFSPAMRNALMWNYMKNLSETVHYHDHDVVVKLTDEVERNPQSWADKGPLDIYKTRSKGHSYIFEVPLGLITNIDLRKGLLEKALESEIIKINNEKKERIGRVNDFARKQAKCFIENLQDLSGHVAFHKKANPEKALRLCSFKKELFQNAPFISAREKMVLYYVENAEQKEARLKKEIDALMR